MYKLPKEEHSYDEYINKLNELYEENPLKVSKAVRKTLIRLNAIENDEPLSNRVIHCSKNVALFLITLVILGIILVGLFNIQEYPMYFFGIIFFLAGYFIGLYLNGFGLIFLLSHGGSGLVIMEIALLGNVFNNPLMTDNPTNIIIYLAINIMIFVAATIMVIVHNLNDSLKKKYIFSFIPLLLFGIGFAMSGILPYIMEYLYML